MKKWDILVDGKAYKIKAGGSKVIVNDEKIKLKSLNNRREGMFRVYELPVGDKTAELHINTLLGKLVLVMDGKDCATGEQFVPVKLPKWSYVFLALHGLNLVNGAVGAGLAILGIGATISVSSNPRFSTVFKVLFNIGMVILSAAAVWGVTLFLLSIL